MSKIGQLPISLPGGVTASLEGQKLTVSGPKGSLVRVLPREIKGFLKDNQLVFELAKKNPAFGAIYGTTRALAANMVTGVEKGWKKELELVGAGYKAEVIGDELILTVGFSHPVKIKAPQDITFKVEKNKITIEGIDKEVVGQVAAETRKVRPPEPYQGKGIKYLDEVIRRKAGKAAKAAGAPA